MFGSPCEFSDDCTPYSVILSSGTYKFEIWGSSGYGYSSVVTPGLGGYTAGILHLYQNLQMYLFIGSHTNFNYKTINGVRNANGGASSDVRLTVNENYDWFDPESLRSRIMIAAGGGSAEWPGSVGGNAGGLTGQNGKSDCNDDGTICTSIITTGANQTSGGFASKQNLWNQGKPDQTIDTGYDGTFGKIPIFQSDKDIGGMGGNGYFSGASLAIAGGGSGGSSFISGHEGCIALNSSLNENPSPTKSNKHYSGIYFTHTKMISGGEIMPLYYSPTSESRGNLYNGCIRITILSSYCSCQPQYFFRFYFIFSLTNLNFET